MLVTTVTASRRNEFWRKEALTAVRGMPESADDTTTTRIVISGVEMD
jgi:hypothetical protein